MSDKLKKKQKGLPSKILNGLSQTAVCVTFRGNDCSKEHVEFIITQAFNWKFGQQWVDRFVFLIGCTANE